MTPASAPITRKTAPKPVARPRSARVALRITESEAEKCGLLDRWWAAMQKRELRAELKRQARARLSEAVLRLLDMAASKKWSQRQLAAKIAIPETTFRRIRNQNVNPEDWLPKIETALNQLNFS